MEKKRLIDCIEILIDNRGKTPKHQEDGTYKILSANNVKSSGLIRLDEVAYANDIMYDVLMANKLVKNDIIITSEAPAGEVLLWDSDEKIVLGQRLYGLKIDKSIVNPIYLAYYLKSYIGQNEIIKNCTGSTVLGISKKTFDNIWVYIPDKKTQEKIGNVLLSIDRQIVRNNEMVQKLQDMIHTIYSVTFEQYLGKEKEMNSILKREIPINWEARELKDFIHLVNGISYSEKDLISGIPMINLNSFNLDGSYKTSGIKKYNGKYKEENTLKPYDLLISKTDVTRNRDIICKSVLVPDYYDTDIVYTSDISKVECINISKYYLNSLFNSKSFHDYIKQFANGTVVLHLIVDGLLNFKIPIPNDCTFDEFDNRVEPLYKQINLLIKNNMDLSKLKDAILPLLINGQLEV